jgi:hypothetical protein
MIERDALMFLQATGEGAKALRLKTSLLSLAYRINSRSPRVTTARDAPGPCVNSTNPHAIGALTRGVKDLLAQSR